MISIELDCKNCKKTFEVKIFTEQRCPYCNTIHLSDKKLKEIADKKEKDAENK